jgi:hypothetical protein
MNILRFPNRSVYPIQNNCNYFVTGYTNLGEQVLMGVIAGDHGQEILYVLFDSKGEFRLANAEPLPAVASSMPVGPVAQLTIPVQQRLGFQPHTIHVRKFDLPDRSVGIEELPEHYQEFLAHPEEHDPDRQEELAEDVRQWVTDGDFVLRWGEDYYLNSDGDVSSS